MKIFLQFICIFIYTSSFAQPETHVQKTFEEKGAIIKQLVQKYSSSGLPGIIISVAEKNQEHSFSGGYADIEKKIFINEEHQVMVASVTKLFLSVATLKLVEEGKLSLDQPITDYKASKLFRKIKHASTITVRHLLNHTSGLADFVKHPAFFIQVLNEPDYNWRQKDLLKFVCQPPLFQPGAKASYSNTNYLLLAIILDYEFDEADMHVNMINDLLIKPLSLHSTYYAGRRILPVQAAKGYAELYNDGKLINVNFLNTGGSGNGYSGLYSTSVDLQKFIRALFIDKTLLSDSSLQIMQSFVNDPEEKGVSYGLGVWKDFAQYGEDKAGFGHRGRDIAFSSDVWCFPKQELSVVLLANSGAVFDSHLTRLYKSLRQEVFETLLDIK